MRILAALFAALLMTPSAFVEEVGMIPVAGEGAKYWPRWRGPSGQGLAAGSGYVDKWSETDNVTWKTKLDTPGNGSPVVWASRIFLTTASTDGTRRGIAAFDRATGRKLWETFTYQDQMMATEGSFIAAFDAKTGARRWWKPRAEKIGWGTPIAIPAGARNEIVISSFRSASAYHPDNGEVLWKVGHSMPEVIPTPVVGHGLVFASFGKRARRSRFGPADRVTSRLPMSRGRQRRAHPSCRRRCSTATSCI